MSFTTQVKNEISKLYFTKSESISELSAFIRNNGNKQQDKIELFTENASIAKHIYTLIKETYNIQSSIINNKNNNFKKSSIYSIIITEKVDFLLDDLSIPNDKDLYRYPKKYILGDEEEKRSYLRGVFLTKGSVNDPKTSRYHLEFSIEDKDEADVVNSLLNEFNLNSKIILRDKNYMVYVKEAEKIGDFLRIISAMNAVMYFEDIRIYRDHKNMTNRLNNCEQANIDKIIESANNQVKDIMYVKDSLMYDLLDDKTKEVLEYRIKYQESSLQELSEIISYETGKTITKSGLNHRFRKFKRIVDKIKENEK